MTTLLYHHPVFQQHDTGPGHPECPERLAAILDVLRDPEFVALQWREAPEAGIEQIERVHPPGYVEAILAMVPTQGHRYVDPDTVMSPRTGEAALRAAGAVCEAVDAVVAGQASNAFCAVRPPGHHAEPNQAMGFCFFNNVAIGAVHALERHGLQRAAVIDFDVHHGNGTQAMFEHRPELLYLSTHQSPLYPGTGHRSERGTGNIINVPLPAGSGSDALRDAWNQQFSPALNEFRPDLILVSAGFDAHRMDPLAGLDLVDQDYYWITQQLTTMAETHCHGRLVSTLEGGYHLPALAASAAAHCRALLLAS